MWSQPSGKWRLVASDIITSVSEARPTAIFVAEHRDSWFPRNVSMWIEYMAWYRTINSAF
jgi:hypothetical protein